MKQVVIRECAFKACEKAGFGKQVLFEIIREAFTGERPDWKKNEHDNALGFYAGTDEEALYEALAPDIFASVREETTPDQMADDICMMLGASGLLDDSNEGE